MAFNITQKHPEVKTILLIRNPFAVTLSMQERRHWLWMTDPMSLIEDNNLLKDYLEPYRDLIEEISREGNLFNRLILVWAIINYIPLRQFPKDKLLVTFYEDWYSDPQNELNRLQSYIGIQHRTNISLADHEAYSKASHTCRKAKSFDPNSWRASISNDQYESAMNILRAFGFNQLYDAASKPNHQVLEKIREASDLRNLDKNLPGFSITG